MQESDIALAKDLVEQDRTEKKILELPYLVESETLEGRIEGKFRTIHLKVCFHFCTQRWCLMPYLVHTTTYPFKTPSLVPTLALNVASHLNVCE